MVRIGVIGAGRWGQNHIRVLSKLDCELVGVADPDPIKKELAARHGIKFESDYKQLLSLVDAVTVVAPTDLHFKIVKECLRAGKHVLVEKPITLNSDEAKELIDLAKKKNLILTVGYIFRFNPAVMELKKLVKEIGDINYITARYVHSNKPPRKDCGVIFNFAVHLIDILGFILEKKPKDVFCKKINYLSKEREDCAMALFDYGDFLANLEVTWFHPLKKRDMWIIGSEEKIYADLLEQSITRYPIRVEKGKVVSEEKINVPIQKNEPLEEELKHFCSCVDDGKMPHVGAEEYFTTKLCELCLESAKTAKEIKVK